jgi:putative methionine-R-sulfoxide reductase with GAF domain
MEELTRVFARECDREERARAAAAAIRRAGAFRWVGLYDVREAEIEVVGWDGPGPPAHPRFPIDQGLSADAIATGERVVVGDVRQDPRYLQTLGNTRSEVIIPVRIDGKVCGLIDVESEHVDAFSEQDCALLERCADHLLPLWR